MSFAQVLSFQKWFSVFSIYLKRYSMSFGCQKQPETYLQNVCTTEIAFCVIVYLKIMILPKTPLFPSCELTFVFSKHRMLRVQQDSKDICESDYKAFEYIFISFENILYLRADWIKIWRIILFMDVSKMNLMTEIIPVMS